MPAQGLGAGVMGFSMEAKTAPTPSARELAAAGKSVVFSLLLGWCGLDRVLLQRRRAAPVAAMFAIIVLGVGFLQYEGPFLIMGVVLLFGGSACVLQAWWASLRWSLDDLRAALNPLVIIEDTTGQRVLERGPVADRYRDEDVPVWVKTRDGRTWDLVEVMGARSDDGFVPEHDRLRPVSDFLVLPPGIIYRGRPAKPRSLRPPWWPDPRRRRRGTAKGRERP